MKTHDLLHQYNDRKSAVEKMVANMHNYWSERAKEGRASPGLIRQINYQIIVVQELIKATDEILTAFETQLSDTPNGVFDNWIAHQAQLLQRYHEMCEHFQSASEHLSFSIQINQLLIEKIGSAHA